MNKQIAVVVTSLVMSAATFACPAHEAAATTLPRVLTSQAAPVTRAQVLADLEIYRQSGLQALDSRDAPDVYGADYMKAQARYQALRQSPAFAMAVARIARERGEAVAGAGATVTASASAD